MPIAVKDLCYTKGILTAAGTAIHRRFKPTFDATVVRRFRDAGAILLGKLQMTEGAYAEHHPSIAPPLNPWDAGRWTGASSSGSGAATAAGLCYASLGSDTGGSIRYPSAANGVNAPQTIKDISPTRHIILPPHPAILGGRPPKINSTT